MARKSRGAVIRPYKLYRGTRTGAEEFVVDTDGLSFGIIFGECEAGYFIAIPQFGVCVPAVKPDDAFYNYERLHNCKNQLVKDNAKTLAEAIMAYFELIGEANEGES